MKKNSKIMTGTSSVIDIDYVSKLANLPLTSKEQALFEKQLKDVLDYIAKLNEINTDNVEPIAHISNLENVIREDEPAPSLTQREVIKNAPKTYNGFFEVDAIFEEQ